jgi:hypothetical protein
LWQPVVALVDAPKLTAFVELRATKPAQPPRSRGVERLPAEAAAATLEAAATAVVYPGALGGLNSAYVIAPLSSSPFARAI